MRMQYSDDDREAFTVGVERALRLAYQKKCDYGVVVHCRMKGAFHPMSVQVMPYVDAARIAESNPVLVKVRYEEEGSTKLVSYQWASPLTMDFSRTMDELLQKVRLECMRGEVPQDPPARESTFARSMKKSYTREEYLAGQEAAYREGHNAGLMAREAS